MTDQRRPDRSQTGRTRRRIGSRHLGDRIRKYRNRQGLSQEVLAHRIGRSEGWMLLVENGRAEPGYFDLLNLSMELNVSMAQLLGDEIVSGAKEGSRTSASATKQPGITSSHEAGIMEADPWSVGIDPSEWFEEMRRRAFLRAAATVTGATAMGWWPPIGQASTEPPEAVTLRDVLLGCRSRVSDGMERPDLAPLKMGDLSLAAIAADRAMATAEGHGSAITLANSARYMSVVLADSGHSDQAVKVCSAAASRFEAEGLCNPRPSSLSVYGQLILSGAGAAARGGDRKLTDDFFAAAESVGKKVGTDGNHDHTAFGPTNITVHRVHAAVVLGDGESAVRQAKSVDLTRLPVLERRAHHLLDVALGYNLIDKPEEAAVALLTAEKIAAEEVRYGPEARLLVEQLRYRNRELSRQLGSMADRMQPPPS